MLKLELEKLDWTKINSKLDFTNIRILEKIYIPEAKAITLSEISKELIKYKISKMKISRRLNDLESLNLIKIIKKTNPLCIWGFWEIEERVKKLIMYNKNKMGIV